MDKTRIKLSLSLLIVAAAIFICGCDLILPRPVPNDEYFERVFRENRADFEKIVRMSDHDDHLTNIRYKFTVVEGRGSSDDTGVAGISKERWDEYRQLFKKTGLDSGIVRGNDGSVHFLAFGRGIAPSSLSKGYFYSASNPAIANVKCTDEPLDAPGRLNDLRFACRNLDKNWYLFLSN